jgi:hypothetical protein
MDHLSSESVFRSEETRALITAAQRMRWAKQKGPNSQSV